MEEEWRDIEGYEGRYQISNLGNVKSLHYCGSNHAQNLIPKTNNDGRLWVSLSKNGVSKPMLIHRLVAMAFIPNPDNLPQINHKDENPKNNCVDNLEWCTAKYNVNYYFERHTYILKNGRKGGCHKNGPYFGKRIIQKDKQNNIVKVWDDINSVVNEMGYSHYSITQCCISKRHTAYGYKWEFAD